MMAGDHGTVVDLEKATGFAWDSLAIYDSYTSYDAIEQAEGVRVGTRWQAWVPESSCFWVFRQGDRRIVGFWRHRKIGDWSVSLCEPPFREVNAGEATPVVRVWTNWQARDLVWLGTERHPDDPVGWRFVEALTDRLLRAEDGELVDLGALLGRSWSELSVSIRAPSAVTVAPELPPSECLFEFREAGAAVARGLWRDRDRRRTTAWQRLVHACPESSGRWRPEDITELEIRVAPFNDPKWSQSVASGLVWPGP